MNYQYLTNPLFLYLLEHPEEKEKNHSYLSAKTGLTRQTVAAHREEIIHALNFFPLDIKDYHHESTNKIERGIKILFDLVPETYSSLELTSQKLDMYPKYIKAFWLNAKQNYNISYSGVYGIFCDNKLIYIGSSENISHRQQDHEIGYRNPSSATNEVLTKYYQTHEINTWEFRVFECDQQLTKTELLQLEKKLIKFLQPCCNIMSK